MHFSSITLLFLFLAYEFFETWNYVVDNNAHVKRFLDFLIDKRALNLDSHRYVVVNGMSTTSAISQSWKQT